MSIRLLLALLGAALLTAPAHALDTPDLDGVWEGPLHYEKSSFAFGTIPDAGPHDVKLRLEIHGPVVSMTIIDGDERSTPRPGVLHIAQVKTNAVIFGSNFATDEGPGWTETWSLIVTPKDDHTLLVSYSRLVNNSGFTDRTSNVKFASHTDGELTRLGP